MVKIGLLPNATPSSKIWTNLSVDQKDQRRRRYGWGRQIFSKSPKENKNLLNVSTACLFKKIDVQYAINGQRMKTKRKR